ncbi:MAG: aspartate dehydrogenase domain-containing protein [Candidatus Omnitrophota bacterium]
MLKSLKIGIVGCGAIGSSLAKTVVKDFRKKAKLVALYDIDLKKSTGLSRALFKTGKLQVSSLGRLISKSDLVIEASSASASFGIAQKALAQGRDILIMSVGGVAGHIKPLAALAQRQGRSIYIPSGAISGIDGLKAAGCAKLKKVCLITRKNPFSFKGVKALSQRKSTVLFHGSARKAIRLFPQNINVAGLLSLAGVGLDKTQVKIIASPSVKKNIHEVLIESSAATIRTRTENILHPDNPRTSYLAVLSALALLKEILNPVKIGT